MVFAVASIDGARGGSPVFTFERSTDAVMDWRIALTFDAWSRYDVPLGALPDSEVLASPSSSDTSGVMFPVSKLTETIKFHPLKLILLIE